MTGQPSRGCLAFVLGLAVLVPGASAQQQPPRFAAGTAVVSIDVLVTRDGKPVTDLTVADFEVRDSGAAQPVQLAGLESIPVSLLLALDTSASVRGPALDQLKDAAKAAVSSLRAGDQAALLTFSQNVALRAAWTDDKKRLLTAIDAATAQGSTSLTDAAFAAITLPPSRLSRTLALIFTDGDDSSSWLNAATVVDAARRTDAVVYGVTLSAVPSTGITLDERRARLFEDPGLYRSSLLPLLSYETGGESFARADTKDLRAAFLDVMARFNQRYVLTYAPPHAAGSGWHPVDVRMKDPGLTVTARRGYTQ